MNRLNLTTFSAHNESTALVILYAKRPWHPYRNCFAPKGNGEYFLAVSVPGGFTGYGDTKEDAISMVRSRLVNSAERARKHSVSADEWAKGIVRRTSPCLLKALSEVRDVSALSGADDVNGLKVTTGYAPVVSTLAADDLLLAGT